MKKGNIVIWLKSSQREAFSPSYHKSTSYLQFAEELNERQNLFFAYDAGSYKGSDVFSPAYAYRAGEMVATGKEVTADIVYNLGSIPDEHFKTKKAKITNTPEFKNFCLSKSATAGYLSEFSPETFFVSNEKDFWSALNAIKTNTVVFKPDKGTNGEGVKIFKKNEAALDEGMRTNLEAGAVLQEYVDTSAGIPGIASAHHDARLVTINERIVLIHVRIPAVGSLVANYAQGATIRELSEELLPEAVLSFYRRVHARVKERFPNPMYSMDMGLSPRGPQLFELNGHTAFPWPDFQCRNLFIQNLVAHLESML